LSCLGFSGTLAPPQRVGASLGSAASLSHIRAVDKRVFNLGAGCGNHARSLPPRPSKSQPSHPLKKINISFVFLGERQDRGRFYF
jgi:hypothetical protein